LFQTFTVTESFTTPNGKFGDNLGNAVVIDCKYIDDYYSGAMLKEFPNLSLLNMNGTVSFKIQDVDFCNYALSINGVLDDQVTTYTGSKANMRKELSTAGLEMINAITYDANVTVTTPLETQLRTVQIVTVFMNTILATIIAFLAILCS
jgi:hypothetical protein